MKGLVLLTCLLLTGCPASWGFSGKVVALRDGAALGGQVVELREGEPTGIALVAVPQVRIECDVCENLDVQSDGRFWVGMGMHYDTPPGVVLQVRAPGYKPMTVKVPEMQITSQLGPGVVTVVLERE